MSLIQRPFKRPTQAMASDITRKKPSKFDQQLFVTLDHVVLHVQISQIRETANRRGKFFESVSLKPEISQIDQVANAGMYSCQPVAVQVERSVVGSFGSRLIHSLRIKTKRS